MSHGFGCKCPQCDAITYGAKPLTAIGQRMEPERFNVIGDELRKLNERLDVLKDSFEQRLNLLGTDHEQLNVRLDKIECEAQQHYERLLMLISFLQDDISKRFDALNQRIERKVTGKKTRK